MEIISDPFTKKRAILSPSKALSIRRWDDHQGFIALRVCVIGVQ